MESKTDLRLECLGLVRELPVGYNLREASGVWYLDRSNEHDEHDIIYQTAYISEILAYLKGAVLFSRLGLT